MTEMDLEAQLRTIASRMDYPRTPDIAGSVTARLRSSTRPRFISRATAWSLTIVLILVSSLMLIPPARAAILEFIQIGVIRIFRVEPTSIPTPVPEPQSNLIPITATPAATLQPLIPLLETLSGEMTLEAAQNRVDYPLLLPSYPADARQPDRIFVQNAEGWMTILIWLDPQRSDQVSMSLHFIPTGSWALSKMGPIIIQETTVNGKYAIWAIGPYPLRVDDGSEITFTRLVEGHVLIWEDGDLTYRLETDLSLEEAIKIAESLEPIP